MALANLFVVQNKKVIQRGTSLSLWLPITLNLQVFAQDAKPQVS